MQSELISENDRKLAQQCVECPLCQRARTKQRGLAFWFVKHIEDGLCPACKAYEKVHGRKAHEPMPPESGRAVPNENA